MEVLCKFPQRCGRVIRHPGGTWTGSWGQQEHLIHLLDLTIMCVEWGRYRAWKTGWSYKGGISRHSKWEEDAENPIQKDTQDTFLSQNVAFQKSCGLRVRRSSHRRGSSRSRRRGVRDWIAPWVWGQKDQDNWWLQGTLFRIYWILYRQKRNSLLDNELIELLIVPVQSPPWTSTSLQQLSLNIIFPSPGTAPSHKEQPGLSVPWGLLAWDSFANLFYIPQVWGKECIPSQG